MTGTIIDAHCWWINYAWILTYITSRDRNNAGHSTVVPADEFLSSESGVWRPRTLTGPFREEKICDSENHLSLSLIQKYVWVWSYVKHLYKHTLLLYVLAVGGSESCLRGRVSFQSVSTQREQKYILTWLWRPWHLRRCVCKRDSSTDGTNLYKLMCNCWEGKTDLMWIALSFHSFCYGTWEPKRPIL